MLIRKMSRGRERKEQMLEIMFGVYGVAHRDPKVEHKQRHSYGEDPIAQRGQPIDILSRNAVVQRRHRIEFTGSQRMSAKTGPLMTNASRAWTERIF